eukprot:1159872-Pelagomonas_calceolata.AAC.8
MANPQPGVWADPSARVGLTLACLASWANRLDLACCVHGSWVDALNWRGTAGFLLQGLGELTHTWASFLAGLTELTKMTEVEQPPFQTPKQLGTGGRLVYDEGL